MRTIVLGDPLFFRIKSGSNPHTRNRFGWKKKVNQEKARQQWKRLLDQLKGLGADVLIIPPVEEWPGMVFPANAGVVIVREEKIPPAQKTFLMSHLISGRRGEENHYRLFFERLGFKIQEAPLPFEGEADFFPAAAYWILTYGEVISQRFKCKWGFPPYRRVYGFRTDSRMSEILSSLVNREILKIELKDERFYHGDTALCSWGPSLQFLLAYFSVLSKEGQAILKNAFQDRLISLSEEDGMKYAANSFYLETSQGKFLLMPQGVSSKLLGEIRERGVVPIEVDVSEFFEKGGGSVKCMILDLGPLNAAL